MRESKTMHTSDFSHMENAYYGNDITRWNSDLNANNIIVIKNRENENGENETYWNLCPLNINATSSNIYLEIPKVYTMDSSRAIANRDTVTEINTNEADANFMKMNAFNTSLSKHTNTAKNCFLNTTHREHIVEHNFIGETEHGMGKFTSDHTNINRNINRKIHRNINRNNDMTENENKITKHYENEKSFSEHSMRKKNVGGHMQYVSKQMENFTNGITTDCAHDHDTNITSFNKPVFKKKEHENNDKGDGTCNDEINIDQRNGNKTNIRKANNNEVNLNELNMNKINYDDTKITKGNIQNAETKKTTNEKMPKQKKTKSGNKEKKKNEITTCEKSVASEIQKNQIGSMYVEYVNDRPLFYVNDEQYDRIIKRRLNRIKQDIEKNRKVRDFVDIRKKSLFGKDVSMKNNQTEVPFSNNATSIASKMKSNTNALKKTTKNTKGGILKKSLEAVPNVYIKNENEKKNNLDSRIAATSITTTDSNKNMDTNNNNYNNTNNNSNNNNNTHNNNYNNTTNNNNTHNNNNNINTITPTSGTKTIKKKKPAAKNTKKNKEKTKKIVHITNNVPSGNVTKKNNVGEKNSVAEANKTKKGSGNTKIFENKKNIAEKKKNVQKNNATIVIYPPANNTIHKTENYNTFYTNYNVEQFNDIYRDGRIEPRNNKHIIQNRNTHTRILPVMNNTNTYTTFCSDHIPEQQCVDERYDIAAKDMNENYINYYNNRNANYINGTYVENHTNQFHF